MFDGINCTPGRASAHKLSVGGYGSACKIKKVQSISLLFYIMTIN